MPTKVLWITMLAIADKNGEVHASIPGLARLAGISIEEAEKSIQKFLSPDPYSRTSDEEGRRVEVIDGGWMLINHEKYRKMASDADRKAKAVERQRRHREKRARNAPVTPVSRQNSQAEAEAYTEASYKPSVGETPTQAQYPDYVQQIWDAYPQTGRARSTRKKVQNAMRGLVERVPEIIKAIEIWSKNDQWIKDGGQFVPALDRWIRDRGFEDLPSSYVDPSKRSHVLTPKQLKGI